MTTRCIRWPLGHVGHRQVLFGVGFAAWAGEPFQVAGSVSNIQASTIRAPVESPAEERHYSFESEVRHLAPPFARMHPGFRKSVLRIIQLAPLYPYVFRNAIMKNRSTQTIAARLFATVSLAGRVR